MYKKKVLFVLENIDSFKEKIKPVLMMISNKEYDVDIVTSKDIDIPFITKKYTIDFPTSLKNISEFLSAKKRLKSIIESEKYDIVESFDTISTFLCGILLKKIGSIEFKAYAENVKKSGFFLKYILKHADEIIVNNEEDYEYCVKKKYNTDIKMIYDLAIDFRKYFSADFENMKKIAKEKYSLSEERKYISVIELNEKGVELIKVAKELSTQNSNISFVIKEKDKKIVEKIEKDKSLNNIIILENIKTYEMISISDAILYFDVFGYDIMTFVYTMLFEKPIIALKNNVTKMYIEELKNGFLYEKGNIQQIILGIGRMVNIPKVKLDELKQFNYERIKKYAIDKYVYSISNLYPEVTKNPIKDIYIINKIEKGKALDRLFNDLKINGPLKAEVVTFEKSDLDKLIEKSGAKIKHFDIKSFNGRLKVRKYITKLFVEQNYNIFSLYGDSYKKIEKLMPRIKENVVKIQKL